LKAQTTFRVASLQAALAAVFVAFLGCALASSSTGAERADLGKKKAEVNKILAEGQAPNELFEEYFKKDFLPLFSDPGRGYSIDDLPKLRRELRYFFMRAKRGEAYDLLHKMVLEKMIGTVISKARFKSHDAAIRYNAMLVISDLNELDDAGKPKPSGPALTFLISAIKSTSVKDYLRTGVLIGLERQAAAGAIPKDKADELTTLLLKLVAQQDPPAGRDPAAHQYLRLRAAQVLAAMGRPGPNNSVVKALAEVAADPKARPTLRCEMAQFMGQFKYGKTPEAEVQQLVNCLGHQTVDICKHELDSVRIANRPPSRRMIVYSLTSVMAGLGGDSRTGLQAAAAGTPTQKSIATLYAKLKQISLELENPDDGTKSDSLDDAVALEVTGKLNEVERTLGAVAAAKKPDLMAAEKKK
jgi:hypothetical protein